MSLQKSLRRTASTAAFIVATMLASTSASATCFISTNSPASTVTAEGSGNYAYGYAVEGVSGSCVSFYGTAPYTINTFEVPYFADAGITAITSPSGWSYAVEATDTFGLGSGAETLVWTAAAGFGLLPGTDAGPAPTLSGFGYTAGYDSVYSPAGVLMASSVYLDIVDPALPGSPDALAAGLVPTPFPSASAVPEPAALLTMLAGLGVVAAARRRRA